MKLGLQISTIILTIGMFQQVFAVGGIGQTPGPVQLNPILLKNGEITLQNHEGALHLVGNNQKSNWVVAQKVVKQLRSLPSDRVYELRAQNLSDFGKMNDLGNYSNAKRFNIGSPVAVTVTDVSKLPQMMADLEKSGARFQSLVIRNAMYYPQATREAVREAAKQAAIKAAAVQGAVKSAKGRGSVVMLTTVTVATGLAGAAAASTIQRSRQVDRQVGMPSATSVGH